MVVIIHTFAPSVVAGPETAYWFWANFMDGLSRPAVPLFFMLTGWALLQGKPPKPKSFLRLGSALLFYSLIAIGLQWFLSGAFPGWGFLWHKPAFYHLWYFYVALAVYGLLAVVQIHPSTPKWALWLIVLGPVLTNPDIGLPIWGQDTGNLFQMGQGISPYIFYAFAAAALARLISWPAQTGFLVGGLLFAAGSGWTIAMTHIDSIEAGKFFKDHYAYGAVGPMLAAYGIFLAGLSLKNLPALLMKPIHYIADRSLAIYGFHAFVLYAIKMIYSLETMNIPSLFLVFIWTVVVSIFLSNILIAIDKKRLVS